MIRVSRTLKRRVPRLFAIDLEGTWLRDDGAVASDDRDAIAEARARACT